MSNREVKTMSKGQSQTRTQSGRRTLERCKLKGKNKNVVFIDEDNGKFHDVIVIDVPESSKKRLQGSRVSPKKFPSDNYISIDDEEINIDESKNGDKGGGEQHSDDTSSKASSPAFSQPQNSEKFNCDECQFIRERKVPFKLSKCKRTYSGKTFFGKRFGLGSLQDSSSSESDSSDCELMEGSSGKIREQWERAALKKRMCEDNLNCQPGLDDEASASGSFNDTPKNVEVENTTKQHVEAPFCSTSSNANDEKENLSIPTSSGDGITGDPSLTPEEDPVEDFGKTVDEDSTSRCRTPLWEEARVSCEKVSIQDRGEPFVSEPAFCDAEVQSITDDNNDEPKHQTKEKEIRKEPQFSYDKACFQDEEENVPAEPFWFNSEAGDGTYFRYEKSTIQDEEASSHGSERSRRMHVNHERVISPGIDEVIHQETSFSNMESLNSTNCKSTNFNYREKPFSGKPSFGNYQAFGKEQVKNDSTCFMEQDELFYGESFYCNTRREDEVTQKSVNHQDNEKPPSENLSSNTQGDETQVNHQRACSMDEKEPTFESLNNTQRKVERSPLLHAQNGNGTHDAHNDIIGEREKLKETDEYKRAEEEEWASRQHQLQLQAEEAQRLKKRKRAETLRLVDMERRQKERVEEMREAQKKNVETTNLKEQLRVEVRKELDKLELMYTDMASLLRALGIRVGSVFYPTSREINAAYKQALLRFHPDRASRTDIRQQVEAEEKFKLISRLKEKLLPIL